MEIKVIRSENRKTSIVATAIWAVVRLNYDNNFANLNGGFCGTAFFIRDNVFITCYHALQSNIFKIPAGNKYSRIFLVNKELGQIEIKEPVLEYFSHLDLTLGKIENNISDKILPLEPSINIIPGLEVCNYGFPISKSTETIKIDISTGNPVIRLNNIFVKEGYIKSIKCATVPANDVNIVNKEVFILSYSAEHGHSGGPLIQKNNNKVIGLMSFNIPKETDVNCYTCAISYRELEPTIDEFISKNSANSRFIA